MRLAAEMAEEIGADILDINCGCPAPKVVKHGGGSGLLKDHERLETILREIKKAITIPLTVKIRAGFYDHTINAVETAKLAEGCGVEHIALHGRTKEQGYRGLANWDLVKQIKETVSVPVSGSGDVTTIEQAFARFRETGCDGVRRGHCVDLGPRNERGIGTRRRCEVHPAFQVMVGCGFALMGLGLWAAFLAWRRKHVPDGGPILLALALASPLGFLAIEAGWVVTEVGRQPWVVYGFLRTADAVSPVPGLVVPFVTFTLLYIFLAVVVAVLLRQQVALGERGPAPEVTHGA